MRQEVTSPSLLQVQMKSSDQLNWAFLTGFSWVWVIGCSICHKAHPRSHTKVYLDMLASQDSHGVIGARWMDLFQQRP